MGEKRIFRAGYAARRDPGASCLSGDVRRETRYAQTRRAPRLAPCLVKVPAETHSRANPQLLAFRASARISTAIRATVAFPVQTSRAVFLIPAPDSREARTAASRSADSLGRPKAFPLLVPFARALNDARRPAQSGQKPLKRSAPSSVYRTVC